MNLSIKLICLFLISAQSFNSHANLEINNTTTAVIIGITSIAGITAYISGAQKRALRTKGHQVGKPTEKIIPYTPGTTRWNTLHTAAQTSAIITGLLALGTSLSAISKCYEMLIYGPNGGDYNNPYRDMESITAVSFFCTALFSASTIASYYIQKYAATRSKKFTQEFIVANPEAYKAQIAKNKDFIAHKDQLILNAIDPQIALFEIEISIINSLIVSQEETDLS